MATRASQSSRLLRSMFPFSPQPKIIDDFTHPCSRLQQFFTNGGNIGSPGDQVLQGQRQALVAHNDGSLQGLLAYLEAEVGVPGDLLDGHSFRLLPPRLAVAAVDAG